MFSIRCYNLVSKIFVVYHFPRYVFYFIFIFMKLLHRISLKWGILTWPNYYDRMNMTESWQWQALTIDHDKNWNRQTLRQVSQPVRAGAGGPIQADRTSIFLGGKVNVCHCRIFRSCSNSKFGNIYLVMWISLFEILGYFH